MRDQAENSEYKREEAAVSAGLVARIAGHLPASSLVALSGAGGKTTLMFSLAKFLAPNNTVLTTTTTKIYVPDPGQTDLLICEAVNAAALRTAMRGKKHVTLGSSVRHGKVLGLSPECVDAMAEAKIATHILVEADGAHTLPFKGYAAHEPVIPSRTTVHVVSVGAEIFLEPLSSRNTFRMELLFERWGLRKNERIPVERLCTLLDSPEEFLRNSPNGALRLLLINKADLMGSGATVLANALASNLREYDFLYIASAACDTVHAAISLKRSLAGR